MGDFVANCSQSEMESRQLAKAYAAFYATLIEGKVDEHTASQLTLMYARVPMGLGPEQKPA